MYPSLVLVQPRKTGPCLTERLLIVRKESNQTNKHYKGSQDLFFFIQQWDRNPFAFYL